MLVTLAGQPRRGSGYQVASGWVLTADHVVAGAEAAAVWLGAPLTLEPSLGVGVDPRRILRAVGADLALVPVGSESSGVMEPVLLGRLDRAALDAVRAAAAGFPRFKLRPAPGRPGVELRELRVAMGTIVPGSDAKTGTLELVVDWAPAEDPQPEQHSPWEGVSGAAVWASGRLVGVVGQHHPRQGLGVLTVRPLSGLFEALSAEELVSWQEALPQLAARAEDLSLATLPSSRELAERRAQRQAADLLPPVLVARDQALAELAAFAGAPQRWRWIQGAAFAGKTALLAWFALHPPEGVDVAACFLRRTTGQAHADYAVDILTLQLAELAERPGYRAASFLRGRIDDFTDLLEDAAEACQQRGRRLLVLVDGLDEDQTAEPGLRVARWLPDAKTLPGNAWLLVSSRTGIPVPLPDRHPLTAHVQKLSASVAASEIQALAEAELDDARQAGGLVYDVLGLLAAASGGLTVSDLTDSVVGLTVSDLTALIQRHGHTTMSSVQVRDTLNGSLARSVIAIWDPYELDEDEPVRVFAHDMLLDRARNLYEHDLPSYLALFDRWAQEYQQAWPSTTPSYLLRPYTRRLASDALDPATTPERFRHVTETLYQVVTHPARSTLLLQRTGHPAVYDQEITTTQRLLVDTRERSGADDDELVYRLAVLALARRPLSGTLARIARSVSSVWAQARRVHSAVALAAGLEDPRDRATALADVARTLAKAGQGDQTAGIAAQAAQAATGIQDPRERARVLAEVATGLAQAGQGDQAAAIAAQAAQAATGIQDPGEQTQVLAEVATGLARAGQGDQAIKAATGIQYPGERARVLAKVATGLAQAGQGQQALKAAAGIQYAGERAKALAEMASSLAQAGQADQAIKAATGIEDPGRRARGLAEVASRLAKAGQADQAAGLAVQAATGIQDPWLRARALADVASSLAQAAQAGQAAAIAAQAAQAATGIEDPGRRANALAKVATGLAQAGQGDQAINAATDIEDPGERAEALAEVATGLAQAGQGDQALKAATGIEDLGRRARALADAATGLAQAGQGDQALKAATGIEDLGRRARALADAATGLAQAGQGDQALKAATGIAGPLAAGMGAGQGGNRPGAGRAGRPGDQGRHRHPGPRAAGRSAGRGGMQPGAGRAGRPGRGPRRPGRYRHPGPSAAGTGTG